MVVLPLHLLGFSQNTDYLLQALLMIIIRKHTFSINSKLALSPPQYYNSSDLVVVMEPSPCLLEQFDVLYIKFVSFIPIVGLLSAVSCTVLAINTGPCHLWMIIMVTHKLSTINTTPPPTSDSFTARMGQTNLMIISQIIKSMAKCIWVYGQVPNVPISLTQ